MKKMFTTKLTFKVFVQIFKFIHRHVQAKCYFTDVHYYFGRKIGGSLFDIPYGYFKMEATKDQVELLKKEVLVIQPFGEATKNDGETEYVVVLLSVTGAYKKYGILFQKKGHLGAPVGNPRRVDLTINQLTNVVLLFPMNINNQHDYKVFQTHYSFDGLMYTQEGDVFFPYYEWSRQIDDTRD